MNTKVSEKKLHRLGRLLVLISLILACGLPNINAPTTSSQQFTNRIIVSLTGPPDGESYPVSAGLSVRGGAVSDGSIARMELWVDGDLYEEYIAPEDELGLLVHYWDWSPRTLGTHTLMVRAYNDQNQTAFSNAIHIKGVEDTGFVIVAKAEEGETVSSIAERYNVSIEDVIRESPNLADSILPAGEEVFVPVGAPAIASVPSAGAKVLMQLSQLSVPPSLPPVPVRVVRDRVCFPPVSKCRYFPPAGGAPPRDFSA